MPIHSLQKLLGHEHLNTTQIYARIYDQTLYRQFKEAMSRLEAIEVDAPGPEKAKHNLVAVTLEVGHLLSCGIRMAANRFGSG